VVDKYRGLLPPGSTWYRLTRDETITFAENRGMRMTPEQRSRLGSSEIQAFKGKEGEMEQALQKAGLIIREVEQRWEDKKR